MSNAGFGQGPSAREAALVRALQSAIAAIGAGRLDEAAAILKAAPGALKSPAGQNILGDVYLKQGKPKDALKAFDAALQLAPNMPEAYCNRSVALQEVGRLDDALVAVDRALKLRPKYATALYNRGNVLKAMHRMPEADEAYSKALMLQPAFPEALLNRGLVRLPLGRGMEALADFNKALSYRQRYAAAHVGRAHVFRGLYDLPQAFAAIDAALAIEPDSIDTAITRIEILLTVERYDEALEAAQAILAREPENGAALSALSQALSGLKRFDEALEAADRSVRLSPDNFRAHLARANVLSALNRPDEALTTIETARRFGAWGAGYLQARAMVLNNLDRIAEAGEQFDEAVALEPGNVGLRYNRAFFLLQHGHHELGWQEHEWRVKRREFRTDVNEIAPKWQGEDLAGKKLLIFFEQGHGDSIQFTRYVPLVAARGARITLQVQEALRRLYEANFPELDVTSDLAMRTGYDYQISLMSLPAVFRTTAATIPQNVPYLSADETRIARWRERIGTEGFKIGIAWQGNPRYGADRFRSIALSNFAPLSEVPGVRLISLQWTSGAHQIGSVAMKVEQLGEEIVNNPDGFREVAAVMANLDLLITSDTGPAHLAGALGRPIWMALARRPDWRWGNEGTTTPWYPTMRLFRQKTSGDWPGVFDVMAEELRAVVAGRA